MVEAIHVSKRIKEFALLPQTGLRLMAALDERDADIDKIALLLSADPGLVATLLRVVNSAFAGMREEVRSVKQAVVILGMDKLRSLVIATGLIQRFHALPGDVSKRFWGHALQTAQWSKRLSPYFQNVEGDSAFLCGLLHNVGELVIRQYLRAELGKIEERVKTGEVRSEAEKAVLGCTRADLAGDLFTEWKMPKAIIESARHSDEELAGVQAIRGISAEALIVHMASAICSVDPNLDALDYDNAVNQVLSEYLSNLRLPASITYDELAALVADDLKQLEPLFPIG